MPGGKIFSIAGFCAETGKLAQVMKEKLKRIKHLLVRISYCFLKKIAENLMMVTNIKLDNILKLYRGTF